MEKNENSLIDRRDLFKKAGKTALVATAAGLLPSKLSAAKGKEKWGMVIDLNRCVGCKACAIACKTEFDVRLGVFKSQVIYNNHGKYPDTKREFLPWLCNHCENAPCVKACPVKEIPAEFKGTKFKKKATYKRPDGIVLVDQDRCIGCGECIRACPYNVRFFDPVKKAGGDKDEHPADKCTFCEHRVGAGIVPACVNTCQGRARIFGDLNNPDSEISKLIKKNKAYKLLPEKKTGPQVSYIGKSADRVDDSLKNGDDIRKEANSIYQLNTE